MVDLDKLIDKIEGGEIMHAVLISSGDVSLTGTPCQYGQTPIGAMCHAIGYDPREATCLSGQIPCYS